MTAQTMCTNSNSWYMGSLAPRHSLRRIGGRGHDTVHRGLRFALQPSIEAAEVTRQDPANDGGRQPPGQQPKGATDVPGVRGSDAGAGVDRCAEVLDPRVPRRRGQPDDSAARVELGQLVDEVE